MSTAITFVFLKTLKILPKILKYANTEIITTETPRKKTNSYALTLHYWEEAGVFFKPGKIAE